MQKLTIRKSLSVFIVVIFGFTTQLALAAIEDVTFADSKTEARYQSIISELRCLVCQNQNLADSDAGLAKDLRKKTAEMIKQGKSDQQILDFMSDRYGEFVLYKPQFNSRTIALWLGPFVLLLIALISLFLNVKRNQPSTENSDAIDLEQQRIKVRELLKAVPKQNNQDLNK